MVCVDVFGMIDFWDDMMVFDILIFIIYGFLDKIVLFLISVEVLVCNIL